MDRRLRVLSTGQIPAHTSSRTMRTITSADGCPFERLDRLLRRRSAVSAVLPRTRPIRLFVDRNGAGTRASNSRRSASIRCRVSSIFLRENGRNGSRHRGGVLVPRILLPAGTLRTTALHGCPCRHALLKGRVSPYRRRPSATLFASDRRSREWKTTIRPRNEEAALSRSPRSWSRSLRWPCTSI